jgi:hypothetical protein
MADKVYTIEEIETLLQEIAEREQKATPGPWATGFRDICGNWGGAAYQRIVLPNGDVWERQHSDGACSEGHTYLDDSNFIIHARADSPILRAIVRQLQETITRTEKAVEEMRDAILNERDSLAESGITSDQVNDVLGVVDDYTAFIKPPTTPEAR